MQYTTKLHQILGWVNIYIFLYIILFLYVISPKQESRIYRIKLSFPSFEINPLPGNMVGILKENSIME